MTSPGLLENEGQAGIGGQLREVDAKTGSDVLEPPVQGMRGAR